MKIGFNLQHALSNQLRHLQHGVLQQAPKDIEIRWIQDADSSGLFANLQWVDWHCYRRYSKKTLLGVAACGSQKVRLYEISAAMRKVSTNSTFSFH